MNYLIDPAISIGKNVVLPGLSYGANYATRTAAPVVGGVVDAVTNPNTLKTAGNFLQETLGAMGRGGKQLVKQATPRVLTGGAVLGTGAVALNALRQSQEEPAKPGDADYIGPVMTTGANSPSAPLSPAEQRESADLKVLIDLIRNQQAETNRSNQAQEASEASLINAAIDPRLIAQRQDIFTQAKIAEAEALQRGAMEKMEEKTRRDVEIGTISAWQGITQAEINKDTALGLGMMSIAYSTGIPQPALMQSAANIVQQGRASYGTPTSVL